jgi:hypothetical protein
MSGTTTTDWRFLLTLYTREHLDTIYEYGLDLHRMAVFIAATLTVGGQVAPVTLQVAETIDILRDDEVDGRYVIESFAYGATWNYTEPTAFNQVPNYVPEEHWNRMDQEIQTEVETGRYVITSANLVVGISAVGMVIQLKTGGEKKVRIVHDLSRPLTKSVNYNTFIDKRKFASVAQACAWLQPHGWQAKTDLSKAYRSIPTAIAHWRLHALMWGGVVYADLRLPFGNRAAPNMFDRLTQAIVRAVRRLGFLQTLGYLDDFYVNEN